jgi:hypothetical protein
MCTLSLCMYATLQVGDKVNNVWVEFPIFEHYK